MIGKLNFTPFDKIWYHRQAVNLDNLILYLPTSTPFKQSFATTLIPLKL